MFRTVNPENQKELRFLWRHYPPIKTPPAQPANREGDFVLTRQVGNSQCVILEGEPNTDNKECIGIGYGTSECSPKDQFNRRIGRKVSLKRALDGTNLPKTVKRKVWEEYFKQNGGRHV